MKKILSFVLAAAFLLVAATPALAQGPGWDRSSLVFEGVGSDCSRVWADLYNRGDRAMEGSTTFEVYFSATGNPRFGSLVAYGEVPALAVNQGVRLVYYPGEVGNYMFHAYQRPDHPGQGDLWSDSVYFAGGCATETPTVTPTGTIEVTPTPTGTPPVDPTVTPTTDPTGTPEVTPTTDPTGTPEVTPGVTPTLGVTPTDPNCDRVEGWGNLYVTAEGFNVGDKFRLLTESGNGLWPYAWLDVTVGAPQPYGLPGQTRITEAVLEDGTVLRMSPASTEVLACLATKVTVYANGGQPTPTDQPGLETGAGGGSYTDIGNLAVITLVVVVSLAALFSRKPKAS